MKQSANKISVNIEKESTEDVFYRIKACHNVVNLLAVDAKTFVYYKKNSIPITAYKADMKFSGWKGWGGSERDGKTTGVDVDRKVNALHNVYSVTVCVCSINNLTITSDYYNNYRNLPM